METHISLTPDLKVKIELEAAARGMSIDEFVRQSLERAISQARSADPLFTDTAVFRDNGPIDVASKHDDYLYGDVS